MIILCIGIGDTKKIDTCISILQSNAINIKHFSRNLNLHSYVSLEVAGYGLKHLKPSNFAGTQRLCVLRWTFSGWLSLRSKRPAKPKKRRRDHIDSVESVSAARVVSFGMACCARELVELLSFLGGQRRERRRLWLWGGRGRGWGLSTSFFFIPKHRAFGSPIFGAHIVEHAIDHVLIGMMELLRDFHQDVSRCSSRSESFSSESPGIHKTLKFLKISTISQNPYTFPWHFIRFPITFPLTKTLKLTTGIWAVGSPSCEGQRNPIFLVDNWEKHVNIYQ